MTRILVTGWRHADTRHRPIIERGLMQVIVLLDDGTDVADAAGPVTLVHGAQRGVDEVAALIAADWGWRCEPHPARWSELGAAAGPARNRHMVAGGALLVAGFPGPGSKGTWGCLRMAAEAGIPALVQPLTGFPGPPAAGYAREVAPAERAAQTRAGSTRQRHQWARELIGSANR